MVIRVKKNKWKRMYAKLVMIYFNRGLLCEEKDGRLYMVLRIVVFRELSYGSFVSIYNVILESKL